MHTAVCEFQENVAYIHLHIYLNPRKPYLNPKSLNLKHDEYTNYKCPQSEFVKSKVKNNHNDTTLIMQVVN